MHGYYREKCLNFVALAEPDPKTAFSRFYGTLRLSCAQHNRKQFYTKPVVSMESRDSEGVPGESMTRHLADIRVPIRGHVTITKIKNLHM